MHWHDWSAETFERARERGAPVLLFLRASWCHWCRELEERTLGAPAVAALIAERFVAIEVDKDRRPDVDSRYRKGGWPTLAVLDAEGEVLESWNHLEAEELARRLERAAAAFPRSADGTGAGPREEDSPRKAPSAEPHGPVLGRRQAALDETLVNEVCTTLIETSDPVHGGWGTRHKFPHPEALHFLMVRWTQTGDADTLAVVLRTLRRMQQGEIYDRVEGGFYRYATQPDWSVPHHEKMLASNAKRLLAYVEAYQALGDEAFRATAEGILAWMLNTLLDDQTGAFVNSQDADSTYAHLSSVEERQRHGPPACDPTIFTNYNADAAMALFKASVVLEDESLSACAQRVLDFLMGPMWDDREGVHHYWDGTYNLAGMLTDQAATLRALVEGMHYAGDNRWLGRAQRLAALTIENLGSEDGSFHIARHAPRRRGGLAERDSALLENAAMAEALIRLGYMTREEELLARAREALVAFLSDYRRFGHHVSSYARAVNLLVHPPLRVTVVGPRDADRTRSLRLAALRPYVANRIVQTVDPIEDGELLARTALPTPGEVEVARAYVDQGRGSYAETSRPERLPALMARVERSD